MEYRRLHPWNVSVRRAARIQEMLRSRLRIPGRPSRRAPALVAGADVSYDRGSAIIFGAVVVLTWPDLEVVETRGSIGRARFPYVPGYLSFREIPILLKAFARVKTKPDLILCEGQGIAHPRRFGLACHLGMVLAVRSVGCAKSRLVGEHEDPARERGSMASLVYEGREVGLVLRTRDGVAPMYVSPGYRIGFEEAARSVLACCRGVRIPEPTRLAHIEVNRLRRESALMSTGRGRRAEPPTGAHAIRRSARRAGVAAGQ
jgi:deoxyribonuclease V